MLAALRIGRILQGHLGQVKAGADLEHAHVEGASELSLFFARSLLLQVVYADVSGCLEQVQGRLQVEGLFHAYDFLVVIVHSADGMHIFLHELVAIRAPEDFFPNFMPIETICIRRDFALHPFLEVGLEVIGAAIAKVRHKLVHAEPNQSFQEVVSLKRQFRVHATEHSVRHVFGVRHFKDPANHPIKLLKVQTRVRDSVRTAEVVNLDNVLVVLGQHTQEHVSHVVQLFLGHVLVSLLHFLNLDHRLQDLLQADLAHILIQHPLHRLVVILYPLHEDRLRRVNFFVKAHVVVKVVWLDLEWPWPNSNPTVQVFIQCVFDCVLQSAWRDKPEPAPDLVILSLVAETPRLIELINFQCLLVVFHMFSHIVPQVNVKLVLNGIVLRHSLRVVRDQVRAFSVMRFLLLVGLLD